ncbi:MAG TPA: alpha/beta hydrolase [Actinomycetota bacterium]
MRRARAYDTTIAYDVIGEGDPAIVVIPQWFLSSRSMRASALVRALAERHRVIVYDRRGTGESDKPGPPYTVARDARDVHGLLDALALDSCVLLGHGVRGSLVGLSLAGHLPGRVRALLCIGGTPRWGAGPEWPYGIDDAAWEAAFGYLRSTAGPPPGASIAMKADWDATGREAAMDILEQTRDEDLRHFLPKVTAPTLVLHMKGDEYVPFEAARWLAESLPNGVLELFDAEREIPFHAHEALADHIEEFLRVGGA